MGKRKKGSSVKFATSCRNTGLTYVLYASAEKATFFFEEAEDKPMESVVFFRSEC